MTTLCTPHLKLCLLTLCLFCGPSSYTLGSLYSWLHSLVWNTWQIFLGYVSLSSKTLKDMPGNMVTSSLTSVSCQWLSKTCVSNMKSELVLCIPELHRQETIEFSLLVLNLELSTIAYMFNTRWCDTSEQVSGLEILSCLCQHTEVCSYKLFAW